MTLKRSKKKLTASLILFIIALIALAIGVCFLVIDLLPESQFGYLTYFLPMLLFFVLMIISFFLNRSHRKNSISAGALSTVLYVFQFIFLSPLIVGLIALVIFAIIYGGVSAGGEELKKIKVTDEEGNEYILTQTFAGSNEYRDQNGDLWKTYDNGTTFERVV